ncbi:MAG TPA: 1-deoxy-D-xylulose-5-phosphate reductoisomerase [Candidatus Wallbacteria bacterium]|nr:MAG: 1-deoxy-D-xylulose 5-phosphate reductoisomerase [bacterium ADurb.Bin243]HPG57031.1 1-deoxy-D-xylulose-5-phosphate reductoisomerase [Candidatus Wallbacteria bacterium]
MGKNIVIIGSTGSIGVSTLEVISNNPGEYNVLGLSCNSNTDLLLKQIKRFNPRFVSVYSPGAKDELEHKLKKTKSSVRVYEGEEGNIAAASDKGADAVVVSVVGGIGLLPTLAAIEKKKKVCLANKETLVCAGDIVMGEAARKKVRIIPIDSEHSAIFQLLEGVKRAEVKRVIITASGGPFRGFSAAALEKVTPEQALKHPNWSMGAKITVDSATLMNKGLEVIEAMKLFGLELDKISVVVHPQSIIHSMIEMNDGSILAQMGYPDMRIPISYALSYPERLAVDYIKPFDFVKAGRLSFEEPDVKKFPCLALAYDAARRGGTMPAVLNAANESAVRDFLAGRIKFTDIPKFIKKAMDNHLKEFVAAPSLEDILAADARARAFSPKTSGRKGV